MGFVANDLCGSVTIFGCLLFRVFPTVNPINKVCCNVVKDNLIDRIINNLEVVGHVDVSQIGYRVVLV
jgi:hypothetical protein